jgi:hypothetical protein
VGGFVCAKQPVVYFFCFFNEVFTKKILKKVLLLTAVMSVAGLHGEGPCLLVPAPEARVVWKNGAVEILPVAADAAAKAFWGYAPENYAQALADPRIQRRDVSPKEVIPSDNFWDTIFSCHEEFKIQCPSINFRALIQAPKLSILSPCGTKALRIFSREAGHFFVNGIIDFRNDDSPQADLLVFNKAGFWPEGHKEVRVGGTKG